MTIKKVLDALESSVSSPPKVMETVDQRIRRRLASTLEDCEQRIAQVRENLLESSLFEQQAEGSPARSSAHAGRQRKPSLAHLSSEEREGFARALAEHHVAIQRPTDDSTLAVREEELYPSDKVGETILKPKLTPDPSHDSLETAYRALFAEELSGVIDLLIRPLLNNSGERQDLDKALKSLRAVLDDLWPSRTQEAATNIEVAGSGRRGLWNRELLRIVQSRMSDRADKEVRELTARIADIIGVPNAPSAEGLRFRTKDS